MADYELINSVYLGMKKTLTALFSFLILFLHAQDRYELNSGWRCQQQGKTKATGEILSKPGYSLQNWLPATVPGTVLTSLLNNQMVPDPFYGMNNKTIPDIGDTGPATYTYWFVKDFDELPVAGKQVWLHFRGINYAADFYLNGKKLNSTTHKGMFLRKEFLITDLLAKNGKNRLAVIVYPPDQPGKANGGQGGDGTIARNLTHQYTAGWDWIQPIRDRNTGIWDKVFIEKTGVVQLRNPHVVTLVPGKRFPGAAQQPAVLQISAELSNTANVSTEALLQYELNGQTVQQTVLLKPQQTELVNLPAFNIENPQLWWPNGYGEQPLYTLQLQVKENGRRSDEEKIKFGVRQIDNQWNTHTKSIQAYVNGQPIFIKGGNWIISDAMLRFSEQRYDAEIRYHRDMNLNLIRIWGGALTERPEFYNACDKYGLLVFQDFWFSGDCNGRWEDPQKADDQWTRRQYPDDHPLVLTAAADQIKMIRNHASLAFWCGGNEITPPADILLPLKDSLLPALDGTRYFFDYSNSDSMSLNTQGGNGDGPYGIQQLSYFWNHRSFPYNSEIGSVGLGDYVSLQRFIPEKNLQPPANDRAVDSVWAYHKYIGYGTQVQRYGDVKDAADFAMKAQLVNYDQYRALAEGFSSHMWDWYTGVMIWKTQNPWTALRGQMYDYYLDVNACLYGLRNGSEALHIMFNPTDSMVYLVNNGFSTRRDLMMEVAAIDGITGERLPGTRVFNEIQASSAKQYFGMGGFLKKLGRREGVFVLLRLHEKDKSLVSENLYWLPGTDGRYTALQQMPKAKLTVTTSRKSGNKFSIVLQNRAGSPLAFFNRIAIIDKSTGKRVLPAFFSDNYVSVLPGEQKTIEAEITSATGALQLEYYGWNTDRQTIDLK